MHLQQTDTDAIEIRDQSGDPFTAVWNWLLDRADMSTSDKLVWIALKSYAGYREIRPSVLTVAKRASVSIRTAQRSFDALSTMGFLRVERRSRPDGGYGTNRYILLAAPRQDRKKGVGDTVTPTPPGVMMAPTPGDTMSPTQVSQCHHIEKIKTRKDITPPHTPREPEKRANVRGDVLNRHDQTQQPNSTGTNQKPSPAVTINDIKRLIIGTQFGKLTDQVLMNFSKQHGCRKVFDTLDVLVTIYKQGERTVKDPVAVLITAFARGVTPPCDFIPYHERIEVERKAMEEAEKRRLAAEAKAKAEDEAYEKTSQAFDALPEEERSQWMEKARATMHPRLRDSRFGARSIAINLFRGG